MDINFCILTKDYLLEVVTELVSLSHDLEWDYWTEENFLKDLKDKWKFSFIVKYHSKIIGYAILSSRADDILYLHHLIVGKEYRGKGVGARMLAKVINIAEKHSKSEVMLKVGAFNTSAIKFYKLLGFRMNDEDKTLGFFYMILSL